MYTHQRPSQAPLLAVESASHTPVLPAQELLGNGHVAKMAPKDGDGVRTIEDFSGFTAAQLADMLELLLEEWWTGLEDEQKMVDLVEASPDGLLRILRDRSLLVELFDEIDMEAPKKRLARIVDGVADPEVRMVHSDASRDWIEGMVEGAAKLTGGNETAAVGVGVLQGIVESLRDAVLDITELAGMVWDAITMNIDLEGVLEVLGNLNIAEMISAFGDKWDDSDPWERYRYRGWVFAYGAGMVLVEGLSLVFGGVVALGKLASKFGKFGALIKAVKPLMEPVVDAVQAKLPSGELDGAPAMGGMAPTQAHPLNASFQEVFANSNLKVTANVRGGHPGFVVEPDMSGGVLNRFAASLVRDEKYAGASVEINPGLLAQTGFGSVWRETDQVMLLSMEDVLAQRGSTLLGHEVQHAASTGRQLMGVERTTDLTGSSRPGAELPVASGVRRYKPLLAFDELTGHGYEARADLALLRGHPDDPVRRINARRSLEAALDISQSVLDTSRQALSDVASQAVRPLSEARNQRAHLQFTAGNLSLPVNSRGLTQASSPSDVAAIFRTELRSAAELASNQHQFFGRALGALDDGDIEGALRLAHEAREQLLTWNQRGTRIDGSSTILNS